MTLFHVEDEKIRNLLLEGKFGLERETLRVTADARMAHTLHPFYDHPNIVRDFSENQTEINTSVRDSIDGCLAELKKHSDYIQKVLSELPEREYLWPFSNPPYILNESDIPIAQFDGNQKKKTKYREYLSDRYGRYKMTFSGIHFNFSFSSELLEADFKLSGETDFRKYKDHIYVVLAERAAAYGWILVSLTAASPWVDSSFIEKGNFGRGVFSGMASLRCSELGYWNFFAPILGYDSVQDYVTKIQNYVDEAWIESPSEFYYPIRLKPDGENTLENLQESGVNHIELRMFDLNPLSELLIDKRDLQFAHLLLVWLISTPRQPFATKDQVQAIQNFKNAARYDLKTVKIVVPNGEVYSVADAGLKVISFMKDFYRDFPDWVKDILEFEENKFLNPHERYAWKIRDMYTGNYVEKGLQLAKKLQETTIRVK